MSRRRAREVALRVLFQCDVGRNDPDRAMKQAIAEEGLDEASARFAESLVHGTLENLRGVDSLLRQVAEEWSLERMSNLDRNVLRLASYELLHSDEVPAGVAINEAVELAKRFSTPESGRFVNGVLAKVLAARPRPRAGDGGACPREARTDRSRAPVEGTGRERT